MAAFDLVVTTFLALPALAHVFVHIIYIVEEALSESVPSVLFAFVATEVLGSAIQLCVLRQSSVRSTTLAETI